MVSKGVIQEYIDDINFAVLGYRIFYIFTKQEEKSGGGNSNILGSNNKLSIKLFIYKYRPTYEEMEDNL
jgi:hypothetical protein